MFIGVKVSEENTKALARKFSEDHTVAFGSADVRGDTEGFKN